MKSICPLNDNLSSNCSAFEYATGTSNLIELWVSDRDNNFVVTLTTILMEKLCVHAEIFLTSK